MRPEPLCDLSGSVVKLDQERITTLRQEDTGQVQKRRTCKYAPQLSNPGYLRGNPDHRRCRRILNSSRIESYQRSSALQSIPHLFWACRFGYCAVAE